MDAPVYKHALCELGCRIMVGDRTRRHVPPSTLICGIHELGVVSSWVKRTVLVFHSINFKDHYVSSAISVKEEIQRWDNDTLTAWH